MCNTTWPHLFWKIFVDFLTSIYAVACTEHDALVKSKTKIFSNFVAFSENPNFITLGYPKFGYPILALVTTNSLKKHGMKFFSLPRAIDNISSPNQRHPPLWHRWFIVHILHAFKLIRSHQTSRNYVFHSRKSFVHPKKYVRRFISVNTNYLHIAKYIGIQRYLSDSK